MIEKGVITYRGMTTEDFPQASIPVIGALKRLELMSTYLGKTDAQSSFKGDIGNLHNFFYETGVGKRMSAQRILDAEEKITQIEEVLADTNAPPSARAAPQYLRQCIRDIRRYSQIGG